MAEPSPPAWPVVVVGSLNLDLVTVVERHPQPGETVHGDGLVLLPGGKGANQALAAARAGARVSLVGRVGADVEGQRYREELDRRGVDVARVLASSDATTGRALICVSRAGENTIVVISGANALVSVDDLDGPEFHEPAVLLLQFELAPDVVLAGARLAAAHGGRVVLNPSPVGPVAPELLALADPLIVNEHEAAQLAATGDTEPAALADTLLRRGAPSVVITLGSRGALVADGSGQVSISAPAVAAIDTTGAGDCFAGTLAAELARRVVLVEAVRSAVDAASRATLWRGAQDWQF